MSETKKTAANAKKARLVAAGAWQKARKAGELI